MNTETKPVYKHSVKVPASLKHLKRGIGAGLMYMALGDAPIYTRQSDDSRPSDLQDLVTVDFLLTEQAEIYLNELLERYTKREIFRCALAWVSRQPIHVQHSNI